MPLWSDSGSPPGTAIFFWGGSVAVQKKLQVMITIPRSSATTRTSAPQGTIPRTTGPLGESPGRSATSGGFLPRNSHWISLGSPPKTKMELT